MDLNNLMTIEEAAAHAKCSVTTIRARIKDGRLTPISKWGRLLFNREEVDALTPAKMGRPPKNTAA